MLNMLRRIKASFLLKVSIGSALAIWLAGSIGLLYSPSAGIITLLTIQNTKKETILISLKRVISFLLAIIIAFMVFSLMGYSFAAFGVFILAFVGFSIAMGLQDGISMNAVLTTHFLIEQNMKWVLIGNEVLLLLIGMGIGILINMIMPRDKTRIIREQYALEEEIKRCLRQLAEALKSKEACLLQEAGSDVAFERLSVMDNPTYQREAKGKGVYFADLEVMLDSLLKRAYEEAGNTLLSNTRYMISYLEMRKLQVGVLKSIAKLIDIIPVILRQSLPIADFMEHTADSFHEMNNAVALLKEIEELNLFYKNEALPVTREEFEYRAILFQILKEFEYFLMLKRDFVLELDKKDLKSYWTKP